MASSARPGIRSDAGRPGAPVRVTRVGTEVLLGGLVARVTRTGAEVLVSGLSARVTRTGVEVLVRNP